ncbi:MAG: UDP-glucose 4-epimerase GalE [Coxiellaceae bacterium]|nr:UDP-glucose 4-epimerase GalE [Coxiellaceae bacterium]
MHILVTGGAGYIGSHMVSALIEAGHQVTVVDDLSTGHREFLQNAALHVFSIGNAEKLNSLFEKNQFDAVMHFASFIAVGESVENPIKYYQNNVANTLILLNTMIKYHVKYFIFSSTAAIFGNPLYTPIDLKHPRNPINPYGHSKQMIETILKDYDKAYRLKSICLRYFNAAGSDPKLRMGECHEPETHLIPLVLQVAAKKRDHIKVFGRDYETPDKTCIRDYIHVVDLCSAHILALNFLKKENQSAQFNLGNGTGYSVQAVIDAAEKVTQEKIKIIDAPRRAGDPGILIADARDAKKILAWELQFPDIETIITHAWKWVKHCDVMRA